MNKNIATPENIRFIDPKEVYEQREKYAALLAKVLDGCYGQDYPGTSLDVASNLAHIADRTQRSVFWAVTDDEWESEKLGTSSMVDASDEFGSGFAEMGKSGSLGEGNAKLGYIRFFREWKNENPFLNDIDALVTTVRNCPARPGKEHGVKSGIGIRVIFLKYLQFEQWGIAPWLLMPDDSDGSYEVLDLLFQFRNKSEVADYLKKHRISLVGTSNRQFLRNFVRLNHDLDVEIDDEENVERIPTKKIGWKLLVPQEKTFKNPIKLVPAENNEEFDRMLAQMNQYQGAMKTIYVPLDASTMEIQERLEQEGWILTGFIPGRDEQNVISPFRGMWSKLSTKRPLVKPDYLDHPDSFSPDWYYEFVKQRMALLSQ